MMSDLRIMRILLCVLRNNSRQGARGILAGSDELPGEFVRNVDGDLHGDRVHPGRSSEAR